MSVLVSLADEIAKLHIETLHPENGESPFVVNDGSSLRVLMEDGEEDEEGEEYVECPQEGCGEALLLVELEGHVEMHEQERAGSGLGDDLDAEGRRVSASKRVKLDSDHMSGQAGAAGFETRIADGLRNLDESEPEAREARERREHELYERQFGDRSHSNRGRHDESENGREQDHRRRKMSNGEREASPSKKSAVAAVWRQLMKMPPANRKAAAASGDYAPAKKRLGVRIILQCLTMIFRNTNICVESTTRTACTREADATMARQAFGGRWSVRECKPACWKGQDQESQVVSKHDFWYRACD